MSDRFNDFYLKVKEIILENKDIFYLPIEKNDLDIETQITDKLGNYHSFFKKYLNELINKNIPFENKEKDVILNKIGILNEGIIKTLDTYLNGKPFLANKIFTDSLSKASYKDIQFEYLIKPNNLFFRARYKSNKLFEKKDLFHIPFEKRHLVSTNRYSIPGIPALYLGDNTYTCWEEYDRSTFKNLYFSVFENTEELNTIQILRTEDILKELDSNVNESSRFIFILRFLVFFPISIACTIKVKNRNGNFKPEYIISQMLLEYVVQNDNVDGIKFPSTRINYKNLEKTSAYNYVFPIKKSQKSGFCPILKEKFKLSNPSSLELEELLDNPHKKGTILYTDKELAEQPEKITIINNDKREYYNTSFGKLDKILEKKNRKKL